uniref:Uncharacterized protein n=1 Tax=Tetranychus urticae TaxID=32264 RepID=T1JYD5_TETUR
MPGEVIARQSVENVVTMFSTNPHEASIKLANQVTLIQDI